MSGLRDITNTVQSKVRFLVFRLILMNCLIGQEKMIANAYTYFNERNLCLGSAVEVLLMREERVLYSMRFFFS
jgi:hypothetical protein